MKKTDIGNRTLLTGSFINKEYKPEWIEFVPGTQNKVRYCEGTFASDDGGIRFSVYDGATNLMGFIDRVEKKIVDDNGGGEYNITFLNAALPEICK